MKHRSGTRASTPPASSDVVRLRMQNTGRRDTPAEMELRRELHRRGLRYRVDARIPAVPRIRPDIVFSGARVAIMVDGCFWHRCPEHGTIPKANHEWWREKLDANVARDRRTDAALDAEGWAAIRVWEHEDVGSAADRIEEIVRGRSRQDR